MYILWKNWSTQKVWCFSSWIQCSLCIITSSISDLLKKRELHNMAWQFLHCPCWSWYSKRRYRDQVCVHILWLRGHVSYHTSKYRNMFKGSHLFGLVILDCELYWTHGQISAQAIEKASMTVPSGSGLYIIDWNCDSDHQSSLHY